jgi:hypothetical protein
MDPVSTILSQSASVAAISRFDCAGQVVLEGGPDLSESSAPGYTPLAGLKTISGRIPGIKLSNTLFSGTHRPMSMRCYRGVKGGFVQQRGRRPPPVPIAGRDGFR